MIERNRHDDRHGGIGDDIGRIEAAAKTHFQNTTSAGCSAKRTKVTAVRISKTVMCWPSLRFHARQSIGKRGVFYQPTGSTGDADAVALIQLTRCGDV